MAAAFGAANVTVASVPDGARKPFPCLKLSLGRFFHGSSSNEVYFRLSPTPKIRFSSKGLPYGWNCSTMVRAQVNEGSEESISEFMNQVSNLVKLVDSKDIVELRLNQHDCELLIRKKEALPTYPVPATYVQSPPQPGAIPPTPVLSPVPAAAASVPTPTPTPSPPPPISQPSKSSHPPLKCPMAGTLYRSPAPGEPPFVKVGDKVQKGQVVCIIEAMKLMNEIEADQSGTIVEILAEDGKPVSVDTPLLVIAP